MNNQPATKLSAADHKPSRKRPALFRALGHADPPVEIQESGQRFRLVRVFKHDSWAATALYDSGEEQIVCKFNREQPILFFPMRWLGRALARREAKMLERLADVRNVPCGRSQIFQGGQIIKSAVAHDFIVGQPLKQATHVDDLFFDRFWELLDAVHRRGIAYVDLHKAENVLVCDRGQPHLIDFQVSVWLPDVWLLRWVLRKLQQMDRYHYARHKLHRRQDLCDAATRRMAQRPWFIRAHRTIARPLRNARRRLLVAIGIRSAGGAAHTELLPEEGLRRAA